MKTIWKFPLQPSAQGDAVCSIAMPEGAALLTVSAETGEPCLWALVDPARPKVMRNLDILGTGHIATNDLNAKRYIGTFFAPATALDKLTGLPSVLVFHVFDGSDELRHEPDDE